MITYVYWIFVFLLVFGVLYLVGALLKKWLAGFIIAGIILLVFSLFYYFYLEQMFVKRWGGTMTVSVPEGQLHIAATWKQDNLWIENYDPDENVCIFSEYSRGNVLEGRVRVKNCNPLKGPMGSPQTTESP